MSTLFYLFIFFQIDNIYSQYSFCLSCTKHNNQPQTWFLQDGPRGGDVRDVQGSSIRLQGWYLVTWGHLDWAGADWATQSWDEPNESPAENSKVGSSYPDAAVTLVSHSVNLSMKSLHLFMLYFYLYFAWSIWNKNNFPPGIIKVFWFWFWSWSACLEWVRRYLEVTGLTEHALVLDYSVNVLLSCFHGTYNMQRSMMYSNILCIVYIVLYIVIVQDHNQVLFLSYCLSNCKVPRIQWFLKTVSGQACGQQMECSTTATGTFVLSIHTQVLNSCFTVYQLAQPRTWPLKSSHNPRSPSHTHLPPAIQSVSSTVLDDICLRTCCQVLNCVSWQDTHPSALELTSAVQAFLFPKGLRCSPSQSHLAREKH